MSLELTAQGVFDSLAAVTREVVKLKGDNPTVNTSGLDSVLATHIASVATLQESLLTDGDADVETTAEESSETPTEEAAETSSESAAPLDTSIMVAPADTAPLTAAEAPQNAPVEAEVWPSAQSAPAESEAASTDVAAESGTTAEAETAAPTAEAEASPPSA